MRQQPQADRPGPAQLPLGRRVFPPGHAQAAHQANYAGGYARLDRMERPGADAPATWSRRRSTTRSISASAAATTTRARPISRAAPRIDSFLCPSDTNAGSRLVPASTGTPNINSYRASIGTTSATDWTNARRPDRGAGYASCQPDPFNFIGGPPAAQPYATGLFCYWISYGINDAPTAPPTPSPSPSRWSATRPSVIRENNSVTGVTAAATAEGMDISGAPMASTDGRPPGLLAWPTRRAPNISNANGTRWAWGAASITMFHTIVPPNSNQYKWNSCRDQCGGCGPDDSIFSNAQSNHSGGCQRPVGRRQREVHQGFGQHADLVGPRHQGQWRGDQLRRLLIDRLFRAAVPL